ncbi:Solute carrier family 22 member 13 [Triplophysa tibetana]|uniref:Solute carrier family 22 member 13 n=1 Tax=Triplophysa tibetana TaxID=1572043 RepID=A0A5A9PBZ2_9TELE|nr:Solute carrier family 22 member 13 [Triplophysa tibetana]
MVDFGEILEAIGGFGVFQKVLLLALCFPNLLLPFHFASVLFNNGNTSHHCNTDWILQVGPNLTKEEQLHLTVPILDDGSFSPCMMYKPVDLNLSAIQEYGLNETTACIDGWVHNDTMYDSTIITDFDLVCGNENSLRVAQTVLMAGILVGGLLFGPLSESLGRKRATQIPVVLMLIFTVVTGLSPYFYMYVISQFIIGISYGGFRINCIILATEWTGTAQRSYGSCLSQVLSSLGQVVFLALIYYLRDWRMCQFIMATPIGIVVLYIWFIPESARWLLDRGRPEDAKKLIQKAAKINKRTIPDSLMEKVLLEKPAEREGIKILFASPVLMKYFIIISFAWAALTQAYYSLSLNVGKFGLNIFLTQLIFGLSEVPVHFVCIWLLEAVGRKASLMGTLLVGGLFCILTIAIPQGNYVAVTALATFGRLLMNGAGSVTNVYIQELFPTSIRQTATGLAATAARVGSLLSPVLGMLEVYHYSIPTVVFSSLAITSGALVFLLPETRCTELPDSVEEAEGKRKPRMSAKDWDEVNATKL